MSAITGHCLCGGVTYETPAEPLATALCHCTECQRQSGSAFSTNLVVPREGFEIEGETLREFETIGTDTELPVRRLFCGECGSPLVSFPEATAQMAIIKSGTLDDTSVLNPTIEVWTGSSQEWVETGGSGRDARERGYD